MMRVRMLNIKGYSVILATTDPEGEQAKLVMHVIAQ